MAKLKMMVLDCPAYHMNDPFVRDIYAKLISLKLNAYRTAEDKYLSVDESDIYATHLIVCLVERNIFSPLIAFKGLTKKRCQEWNRPFNANAIIQGSKSELHIRAVTKFISDSESRVGNVGYTASLALDPFQGDHELRLRAKSMFLCMMARFHTDFGIENSMCIARLKVKSNELLEKMGYEPLQLSNLKLFPVVLPQYVNNEYLVMVVNSVSEEGKEIIHLHKNEWDSRIIIGDDGSSQRDKDIYYLPGARKKAS